MFGISSFELLIIFVVALIVIGPQKMPEAVRSVGRFIGKVKNYTDNIRSELERELHVDEVKESLNELKNSESMKSLQKELTSLKSDTESAVSGMKSQLNDGLNTVKNPLDAATSNLKKDLTELESSVKKPLFSKHAPSNLLESGGEDVEALHDEDLMDELYHDSDLPELPLSEADLAGAKAEIEAFEADNFSHSSTIVEEDDTIMTAPPKGFNPIKSTDGVEVDWQMRLRERQLEIAAKNNESASAVYEFLKRQKNRKLLTERERHERYLERLEEINRAS